MSDFQESLGPGDFCYLCSACVNMLSCILMENPILCIKKLLALYSFPLCSSELLGSVLNMHIFFLAKPNLIKT